MNKTKRIIAVIGVPRSGTSAVAKGLESIGVNLGSYVPSVCREDNEKGFFEDLEINAIDIAMLNSVGYRWGNPVSPLFNEESRRILSIFFPIAKNIISKRLESDALFGFKDPLISILLPFWKEIFKELKADVDFVIVNRNPLSMAKSLQKAEPYLDKIVCLYIWTAGMLSSIIHTAGYKRITVDYDELIKDPIKQLERLNYKLDIGSLGENEAMIKYKEEFLSDSLRHNNYSDEDILSDADVPPKIAELYFLLKSLAKDEAFWEDTGTSAAINKIYSWVEEFRSTLLFIQAQSDALLSLRGALIEKDKKINELTAALDEKENQKIKRYNA